MYEANSSFIVKLEDDFEDNVYHYMVMKLVHYSDLFSLLEKLRF